MKSKILKCSIALAMIVPLASGLAACSFGPSAEFNAKQDVSATTESIIKDLTDNYYNANALGLEKTYSVEELKSIDNDFVYYVEAGELSNIDNVETIMLGDSSFQKDATFSLSIGNSNYIVDKCFYLENNIMYIAAPIVAFETINNTKIKINDKEFEFNLESSAGALNFSDAKFSLGSTNTVSKNEDESLDLKIKDAKSYLALYYEGATADDVVLTRRVVSNSGNSEINNKVNYGLTKVENYEDYPVGLYPVGYSDTLTDAIKTAYDGATMNYKVYVVDKGVVSVNLNFNIEE